MRGALHGHTGAVRRLVWSPDGRQLASAGADRTIRVWDLETGACLRTLSAPAPYAGMDITGVTGISEAQRDSLCALGAVENA